MKTTGVFTKASSLVSAILLLLMLSVPVMAESPIGFEEKIQTKDNIIVYEIQISPDSDICGLSFEIKYSEDQVKVGGCTMGTVLDGGIAKSNDTISGKVVLTYISTTPLKDGGSVILVEFEALSTDNKYIDIDCVLTECIDWNCDEIAYRISDKEIANPRYVEPEPPEDDPDVPSDVEKPKDDPEPPPTTQPPSSGQEKPPAEKPTINPDVTVPDDLPNQGDESTPPTDNSNPESESPVTDPSGADADASDGIDKEAEQNKTNKWKIWVIVLIGLGCVLLVACLIFIKPIILKRGCKDEKK